MGVLDLELQRKQEEEEGDRKGVKKDDVFIGQHFFFSLNKINLLNLQIFSKIIVDFQIIYIYIILI